MVWYWWPFKLDHQCYHQQSWSKSDYGFLLSAHWWQQVCTKQGSGWVSEGVRNKSLCDKNPVQQFLCNKGFCWLTCLRALGINNQVNHCYISTVHLPSCYQGIVNHDSLLITNSGASVCITPNCLDFITYHQSKMNTKDFSSSNNIAGEGLLCWKRHFGSNHHFRPPRIPHT